MEKKCNLSAQKIFDKQFSIDFKGYSAEEVDQYLDLIIQDYQSMESLFQKMQEKTAILEQNNATLKSYIVELEGKQKSLLEAEPANATDILKRLSRLEEKVYNNKEDL